ncbi:MAG TPA: response regulator [Polyangiaceae bacterium]|nr:response regulator [Polyangiaceae bacterium]
MNASDRMPDTPLRVLVVDDSETDAKLIALELRRSLGNVRVRRVDDLSSVRNALQKETWDVVTCDWSMPRASALGVLELVREAGLDVPFIIISGTVSEETAVAAMRAGAHDYVLKDKLTRLVPSVERELRESKVREAHRQSENRLRASEERYRRIVETTSEGVWTVDRDLKTTFMNARMLALTDCDASDIEGTEVGAFVEEGWRTVVRDILRGTGALAQRQDIKLRRQDGGRRWVRIESTPVFDERGQFEGALAMVRDETDRRGLEERLSQAQKMEAIGRLAGGVAHDFNNLLTVVLSCASLVLATAQPDDPIVPTVDEIRRAGERAAELTRQLLAFSRQQILQPRILRLDQVVLGSQTMLRRLLGEDVVLELATHRSLSPVRADPGQIEQVLLNLVVNARDAMPNGGKVTIETADVILDSETAAQQQDAHPGEYVRLAVTDTGTGMDSHTQIRIFDPFFTTKEVGKGTGLGLSTVYGIVKQSGGHVTVLSERGKGSTFSVYLPQADGGDEGASSAPPPARLASGGSETVLLVEDEDVVRKVVCEILRRSGYKVIEAPGAAEALAKIDAGDVTVDLLLTDVVMPRMNGRELAEKVVGVRPATRVLFMSGYTADTVVRNGVLAEGVAFVQKPITPDTLLAKVRDVLDGVALTFSASPPSV